MDRTVICVRGPSGSGKTSLIEALAPLLRERGLRTAVIKRSHHTLDVTGKDSDRLVRAGAAAVIVHDAGGTAIFRQDEPSLTALLALLPSDVAMVLVETFRAEHYPVLLAEGLEAVPGETLLGRFTLPAPAEQAVILAGRIAALAHARSRAAALPPQRRPHRCAGAVLGQRLAAYGAALLGVEIPRADHRLYIECENDGCAADALIAATGCHPGSRSLRFAYQGKLAATFVDAEAGRAVRVHAHGDLRARATALYPDSERHTAQLLAYEVLADEELFGYRGVAPPELPARRPGHRICSRCGEEVDGDAAVMRGNAVFCRPCHDAPRAERTRQTTVIGGPEEAG